jgi:hypothetical protein
MHAFAPHCLWPLLQVKPHAPAVHVTVALATAGQSAAVMQQVLPLTHIWPHGMNPPPQLKPHTPALHVALPFATDGQALHIVPQLDALVLSAHVPLQL